jgi:ABC-2 type transport system permease protein
MLALRHLVPFAYANDALKTVFGLSTGTAPVEAIVYPTLVCAVMALGVCLTAPRLLRTRL